MKPQLSQRKGALFASACILLFAGCGSPASVPPVINHEAQAKKLSDGSYEVQLSYRITYRRPLFKQPLLQFSFLSYEASIDNTNWLYLARTNGTVDGSNVVVMTNAGKDLALVNQIGSRVVIARFSTTGTVCFSNGMMTVNLNQKFHPVDGQSDYMLRYAPYGLNGTYQLE